MVIYTTDVVIVVVSYCFFVLRWPGMIEEDPNNHAFYMMNGKVSNVPVSLALQLASYPSNLGPVKSVLYRPRFGGVPDHLDGLHCTVFLLSIHVSRACITWCFLILLFPAAGPDPSVSRCSHLR